MLRFHTLRRIRGPADLRRLDKVAEFYRAEFPSSPQFMEQLRAKLLRPLRVDYAATLITAESLRGEVQGFAFYDHFPDLNLSYLEYIVTAPGARGRGVGGGLYEAMRESLHYDGSDGLLFEVNPDDPTLPPEIFAANKATLKFYEKYDARPLEGVRFDYPPFLHGEHGLLLLYDDLGTGKPLDRAKLRSFMLKLYAVKYNASPKDPNVERVLAAIPQQVARRPRRYLKEQAVQPRPAPGQYVAWVHAVVSDAHLRHEIPERDYLERPLRVGRLLDALRRLGFVAFRKPKSFPDKHILAVHDPGMVRYL
ncbi:MAG TPA: GNAT family N-acetyltransferase, partial [Candidatus Thermoplasmatota archaeon]|nr:GNAT family N-acetyltransferase [Candidatus Thermoplasmatota archaeon]